MLSHKRAFVGRCFALIAALALTACPEDNIEVKNLFLEITSEVPTSGASIERLRLLFEKDGAHYPLSATDAAFNPAVGVLDPARVPLLLSIPYDGKTFGDGRDVVVNITGWAGGSPQTRFEGAIDLTSATIVKVRLVALPNACDVDNDGFLDCSVAGCCSEGSAFGDCDDTLALANPWGVEVECEPCSDTVDQDCSGGDQPCIDLDGDTIADCAETCGKNDPKSGPGLPEICDGKDNDCDNVIDEGLFLSYGGQVLEKGQACGVGLCAGGIVECDGADGMRCSSDSKRAAVEDCGTPGDDNCNGIVNEGCSSNDFDGDGFPTPADCNDFDAGVYPGRLGEPCCPTSAQGDATATAKCDLNCDGQVAFCEVGDADGDGITVAEGDCDDNDPTVAPGKPERCGDGIDQDCSGGDLACATVIDADGDGWPMNSDCDDNDPAVHPGALEICNGKDDDCNNMTDEGNPGGGARCGTSDVGECAFGAMQCQNSVGVAGTLVCVGAIDAAADDVCNGKDDDCDGQTDEDFDYLGQPMGAVCDGVGACGQGVVECVAGVTNLATCSTNPNGSSSGASPEVCDGVDNDCDGALNEGLNNVADSDCLNLGVCAAHRQAIAATCTAQGTWACDYTNVPGYEAGVELSCDDLDNNCDGLVNEGIVFTQPNGDVRPVGSGCDGDDSDQCANGIVTCDPGNRLRTTCVETGGPQEELCDGVDNDCDGETDEDFRDTSSNDTRLGNALAAGDNGRFLGDSCGEGACQGGAVVCGSTLTLKCSTDPRTPANPNPPIDVCDGIDNDCDGAVDESYIAGGTVKLQNALFAADNGKVKDAACGTGECAGGKVICGSTTTLACSTDVNGQTSQAGQTVTKTDICNGKDDNCNGITDDAFVATSGTNRKPLAGALYSIDNGKMKGAACGIGVCLKDANGAASPGSVVCNAEGTALVCSSDGRAKTDVCDELDNDCDGAVDEPFTTAGGTSLTDAKLAADNGKLKGATCGAGSCASGRVVCAASKTALVCNSDSKATVDLCDGFDNDCDGEADEDFRYDNIAVGGPCDGVGACGAGTVMCAVGSTTAATCSTNPNGPASEATIERCDAQDNNCDGVTDEGFNYEGAALGADCTGKGVCGAGKVVCAVADGTRATCSTMPGGTQDASSPEICDGLDNDCDGQVNEDYVPTVTSCGKGVCTASGMRTCSNGAEVDSCTPGAKSEVSDLTCDGLDGDCDGFTDEDYVGGATACGVGACAATGSTSCVAGSVRDSCTPGTPAASDATCNGIDDDCADGTDEDYVPAASTCGVGACAAMGTKSCVAGSERDSCTPGTPAMSDATCNGIDDDCADGTDEDYVTTLTACGVGACAATGTKSCVAGSERDSCTPGTPAANDATCNGIDDDCADGTDEDYVTTPTTCGVGVCLGNTGVNQCVDGGVVNTCDPLEGSSDEICNGLDDDCDDAVDEGFSDVDNDGDCDDGFDPCVDVDNDKIGRDAPDVSGMFYSHLGCRILDPDCNDEPGNGLDLDGDNICNTGVGAVCQNGLFAGCDDNCPDIANALQTDTNNNAIGDTCDACVAGGHGEPFEVCGNCLDDDCDPSTVETSTCVFRRILSITTPAAGVPAGYSMSLTFDHAFLVAAGRSTASGNDIRLYYRDASGVFSQIDRVLDPESSWSNSATKIWFKSQAPINPTSSPNRDYYLYSRVTTGSPLADETKVFQFVDFFDRDNGNTVGAAWNEQEDGGATSVLTILDKAVNFATTSSSRRQSPAIFASLTQPLSTGRALVRAKWNWTRVNDSRFALAMQIGSFTSNVTATNSDTLDTANTIATVAWGRDIYSLTNTSTNTELAVTKDSSRVSVMANFDGSDVVDTIVDFGTGKVSIDPDGDGTATPFGSIDFFSSTATLTGIRFFASRVDAGSTAFSSRKFDYVYIRKLPAAGQAEPSVKLGGNEVLAPRCPLTDTGLIARYFLDDPRDEAEATEIVKDAVTPRLDLERIDMPCGQDCMQPIWTSVLGLFGLSWTSLVGEGRVEATLAGTNTKFVNTTTGLGDATTATIELVVNPKPGDDTARYLLDIYEGTDHRLALTMQHKPQKSAYIFQLVLDNSVINSWTIIQPGEWTRTVLHLSINLDAAGRSGVLLFRDGFALTPDVTTVDPTVTSIDMSGSPHLVLGNSLLKRDAAATELYYVAFYRHAFTGVEALANYLKLIANDDRR